MRIMILGPCLCQGCGQRLYWGRGVLTDETICWRDMNRGAPHNCKGGRR